MQIDNRIFFEQIETLLGEGREVQITVRGNSMRPLLRNGRDIAVLKPCRGDECRPGDVVLFRYEGRHVLHRIIRHLDTHPDNCPDTHQETPTGETRPQRASSTDTSGRSNSSNSSSNIGDADISPIPHPTPRFLLRGDGNYRLEEQCRTGDILAVMTHVIRPSGRTVACTSRRWRYSSRLWLCLPRLLRRGLLSAASKLTRR